ncbi:hypothetical protein [Streptomyces sp. CRN 30]|uniref:hypothetical protein n=1 Tax=Streptomyces sp. CRN 30 TaxID=3075613 RepID=UPI002A817A59|nr:hypothetical protein [Streptomyces sp. CRN 30]
MKAPRRTIARTVPFLTGLLTVLLAGAPAHAAKAPPPVVRTGDVSVLTGDYDILEDVLEHITMKDGDGPTAHQIYDYSGGASQGGADVPE